VQAAQVYGLKTVAVATGSYKIDELEKCGADYFMDNLSDKENFFKILGHL
jgi:phosphoglycolate phosphatase-like HAD superfamily hydrolase